MHSPYQATRGQLISWLADDMIRWDYAWGAALLDLVAEVTVLGMFRIDQVYEPVVVVQASAYGKTRWFCIYLSQTSRKTMCYEPDEAPPWSGWQGDPGGKKSVINGDKPEIFGELKKASGGE